MFGAWLTLAGAAGAQSSGASQAGTRGAAQSLMAPPAFTEAVATSLRGALPGREVEIRAPLEIRYRLGDGKWSSAFLANAYQLYRQRPSEAESIIAHFARVYASIARDADAPVDVARIVPVVKDRRWLEDAKKALRAQPRAPGAPPPSGLLNERLSADLVIVYAEDTPSRMRYLTGAHLAKAGIERSRLRETAIANLKRALPRLQFHHRPDVGVIEAGGVHEASLLLLPDVWIELKGKIDGDPVIAVPARGKLMFTGSRNSDGVRKLRRVATETARRSSNPLTSSLLTIRDGKIEDVR